jgi:hypothetical protein
MEEELSVAGQAPRRADPGSCADRNSPNAAALFQAATKVVAERPHSFPLRGNVVLVISSEAPLHATTAIVEVLVDAGLLHDERQLERERHVIDPALRDRYIVVVKTEDPFGEHRHAERTEDHVDDSRRIRDHVREFSIGFIELRMTGRGMMRIILGSLALS